MDGYMAIINSRFEQLHARLIALEVAINGLHELPPIAKAKAKADAEAENDPMTPMMITDGDRARS